MIGNKVAGLVAGGALLAAATLGARAEPGAWFSGDWHLTLGAAVFTAPDYAGARDYLIRGQPLVSLSRAGAVTRFSSRNDNISIAVIDTGDVRVGATGRIVFRRDAGDSPDLAGLDPVRWGAEVGAFAEVYPTGWLRLRGELRRGIRAHDGVVADLAADAFVDVTPTVRLSGGPRLSAATADYFDAYYGVGAAEAAASGLGVYAPAGGIGAVGLGGAVTWQASERVTTSLFGEYSRLMGPAADSTLVRQRGARDQFLLGVSATYRFDVSL